MFPQENLAHKGLKTPHSELQWCKLVHPKEVQVLHVRASYGVYFVNICEKINSVITAPHCMHYDTYK